MTKNFRLGLLTSIGTTLDAFFVEIASYWRAQETEVLTAAGTRSTSFPDQAVIRGLTRNPSRSNVRAVGALRQWATSSNLDALITNTATASALVRVSGTHVPVIYFCHGLHWAGGTSVSSQAFALAERALLRRTAGIVCLNASDDNWFERYAPSIPRLRLLHGVGLDTVKYPRTPRLSWDETEPVRLVWCGGLVDRKNPGDALQLARQLQARGVDFRLDILGDGPLRGHLETDLRELKGVVRLQGRVDPVPYFAKAHALVQTSRWEGLPRVALEAVAMGLPTVGYDVKGVQDIPGTFLAPPGDIARLADICVEAARAGARGLPDHDGLSYAHAAQAVLAFTRDVAFRRTKPGEYRQM
jgi:glycosyltransferase involved in cell wall biosynthesis